MTRTYARETPDTTRSRTFFFFVFYFPLWVYVMQVHRRAPVGKGGPCQRDKLVGGGVTPDEEGSGKRECSRGKYRRIEHKQMQ